MLTNKVYSDVEMPCGTSGLTRVSLGMRCRVSTRTLWPCAVVGDFVQMPRVAQARR